jgi:hypothetical protein
MWVLHQVKTMAIFVRAITELFSTARGGYENIPAGAGDNGGQP